MCPECHQESLSQVSYVYRFVQENPQMTLEDIADHCHVPFKELEKMFFEGKLGTAASNVIYHCQRCGRPMSAIMRRGRFCIGCAEKIETEAGISLLEKEKQEKKPTVRRADRPDTEPAGPTPIEAARRPEADFDREYEDYESEEPASPLPDSYGFKRINEG